MRNMKNIFVPPHDTESWTISTVTGCFSLPTVASFEEFPNFSQHKRAPAECVKRSPAML